MADTYTPTVTRDRVHEATIQRFGGYLAGMVMPNIGAFIAWGLITALFIPTGWMPNEDARRAGRPDDHVPAADPHRLHRRPDGPRPARRGRRRGRHHGRRRRRRRPDVPRRDDHRPARRRTSSSCSTSSSRSGSRPASRCWSTTSPPASSAARMAHRRRAAASARSSTGSPSGPATGVDWLVNHDLLPLASVLIEPAKVLFLNNAINHGVLGPLGVAEAAEHGQVDPVHAGVEPRPRPRPAARLPVLRPARAAPQRPGRDHHPVPRRHPRDLLPVRADEAAADPRHDRRRRRRRRRPS